MFLPFVLILFSLAVEGHLRRGCRLNGDGLDIHFIDGTETNHEDLRLEISWWDIQPSILTQISFWDTDPQHNQDVEAVETYPVRHQRGRLLVDGQWGHVLQDVPQDLDSLPGCLNLWAGLMENGTLINVVCLRLNTKWMEENSQKIGHLKLSDTLIPGAHTISHLSKTSLWLQLLMGVRYFEILSWYSYENSSFIVFDADHDSNVTLPIYLDIIHKFLNKTNEIVILELAIIPYSDFLEKSGKRMLENILLSFFGDLIALKGHDSNPELGQLWINGKKLIIASRIPTNHNSDLFWDVPPKINFTRTLNNRLVKHLKIDISRRRSASYLWAIQGPTYSAEYINDPSISRLHEITREKWWKEFNIVSLPGLLGASSLTALAIEANKKRGFCRVNRQPKRFIPTSNLQRKFRTLETINACSEVTENETKFRVWPTIKASSEESIYRLIQVNWKVSEVINGDFVGVYQLQEAANSFRRHPKGGGNETRTFTALYFERPFSTEGKITSNITFPRYKQSQINKGGCFNYFAVYIRNGEVAAHRCISSHPKWIWDNRSILGSRSLRSLVIPGTHNAGSYAAKDYSDFVVGWVICQDEDILTQLLYGIRYLDLRVGYYPDTKELLWINHDVVQWIPLQQVLADIRSFALLSPDPVIINFHKFPVGFDKAEATQLIISYLNETLGEYLLDSSVGTAASLQDIWGTGRSLVVSFNEHIPERLIPWMWREIPQAWADAQTFSGLKSFLDKEIRTRKKSKRFCAAMGHLTPSVWDFMLNSKSGNRALSDRVGRGITDLLRLKWRRDVNIFAVDFFHTTDIIWTSILLNLAPEECFMENPQQMESSMNSTTSNS